MSIVKYVCYFLLAFWCLSLVWFTWLDVQWHKAEKAFLNIRANEERRKDSGDADNNP